MTFTPPNSHSNGLPLGLTGATAATRYVGGTTSGAPASGTFAVGDFVIDETGSIYVCTVAGTPGTWVSRSSPFVAVLGSGLYQASLYSGTSSGPLATTEALVYTTPWVCRGTFTADRIAVFQSTAGGASCVVRLGIYASASDGSPGGLVVDGGTYDASSGSSVTKTVTISKLIQPGLYWIAAVVQGSSVSRPTLLFGDPVSQFNWLVPTNVVSGNNFYYYKTGVTGALPDPFGAASVATTAALLAWIRGA